MVADLAGHEQAAILDFERQRGTQFEIAGGLGRAGHQQGACQQSIVEWAEPHGDISSPNDAQE
jgi:hypothetical protein